MRHPRPATSVAADGVGRDPFSSEKTGFYGKAGLKVGGATRVQKPGFEKEPGLSARPQTATISQSTRREESPSWTATWAGRPMPAAAKLPSLVRPKKRTPAPSLPSAFRHLG